jgi:hypothetical protein
MRTGIKYTRDKKRSRNREMGEKSTIGLRNRKAGITLVYGIRIYPHYQQTVKYKYNRGSTPGPESRAGDNNGAFLSPPVVIPVKNRVVPASNSTIHYS